MKIVQVSHRFLPSVGGIEMHILDLSKGLMDNGIDVEVISADSGENTIEGIPVRRFRSFSPGENFYISPQMYFYLKKNHFDIIHAHNYRSFPALFASLAKGKRKFVFTPHTLGFQRRKLLHSLYRPLGSSIFKAADKVVSISKIEKEWLEKTFNAKDKVTWIPHPVKIPEKTPFTGDIKRIGFVGRLSSEKNADVLISAFKKVRMSHPEVELFLAGDGPLQALLERIAGQGVHFLGRLPREEVFRFLTYVDLIVLPSQFEVAPLSILEAMARSRPVIVTPVGELPYILRDGKECLFVRAGDPADLAEKTIRLIEDKELSKRLSGNGRVLMEEKYDMKRVINEYIRMYNGLL